VLTDPPYGIDMDNIQQAGGGMNVDSVRATHDVQDNLSLIKVIIPLLHDKITSGKYCVLFCDAEHFEKLLEIGTKAGFKAQRWPLVWCKTHTCQNMAAQYNFTKATEFAIVFRKGESILAKHAPRNWFECSGLQVKKDIPDHPFVKPKDLWLWIADKIALDGASFYEPFMGRGSMPLALLGAGYKVIGTEIDEAHYNAAIVNICNMYRTMFSNVEFE